MDSVAICLLKLRLNARSACEHPPNADSFRRRGVPTAWARAAALVRRPALEVLRNDMSVRVMPITALAGAVPHSGLAVGASVRDLTTRWHWV
jgi:hypothetical protein